MDKDFFQLIESAEEMMTQSATKLDDDILICECFCVNVGDIRSICKSTVDIDLLKGQLNLGSGCQSCLKNLDTWVNKIF